MANFTLTVNADTVVGTAADDTVSATAGSLNEGDSLTGGAGTDVLTLVGSMTFPRRPARELHWVRDHQAQQPNRLYFHPHSRQPTD